MSAAGKGSGEPVADAQPPPVATEVALDVLQQPLVAINAGVTSFAESLKSQDARVVHVDWKPPAGGNERLMAILERMKR